MAVRKLGAVIAVESDPAHDGVDPTIAGGADGRFLVAWEGPFVDNGDEGPRNYSEIFARTFGPDGAIGSDILVNSEMRDPQFAPDATVRADGSYVIAYDSGVEDQLEGTFLANQRIGADGAKIGGETYSPDYSYYKINPNVASFADGSYVVVAAEDVEDPHSGYVYSADGTLRSSFSYGYHLGGTSDVTVLDDARMLLVWSGYDRRPGDPDNPATFGVWAQIRDQDGNAGAFPFLIAQAPEANISGPNTINPNVRVLPDGNVVAAFALDRGDGSGSGIYVTTIDFDTLRRTQVEITTGKPGDQSAPDVAVLSDGRYVVTWRDGNAGDLGDADGSGIVAQVFNRDGSSDDGPFLVNTATAGDQTSPTVAALGTDFVIAWAGPDGIEAQRFDADALAVPDAYILTRQGTLDASPSRDQVLAGGAGPNSVYVDVAVRSGQDAITLGTNDVVVSSAALPDPDRDRVIVPDAQGGRIDLDGASGESDTIRINDGDALRFLGTRTAAGGETLYAYGRALDLGAVIEGTIGRDTLRGTTGKDFFLFDTALGLGLGMDQIKGFGAGDRIVTTTRLADPDNDGRIHLNSSDRLLFDTPAADGASSLKIFNTRDKAVSTLVFDASYTDADGHSYFVYAAAGDRVASGDLFG